MRVGGLALVLAAALHVETTCTPDDIESKAAARALVATAPESRSARAAGQPQAPPAGLTGHDWDQIRGAVRRSEYHPRRVRQAGGTALHAPNRQQRFGTAFRREGIEIAGAAAAGPWRLRLSVTGYGYEQDVRPLEPTEPQRMGEKIEYRRVGLTEWYTNRPDGLEQGFELPEMPARSDAPLVIQMAVQGELLSATGCGDEVCFAAPSGETVLRYAGLKTWDAGGRPLRSHFEAEDHAVRLVVDARSARFPVTIDPVFVHEAQLFGHPDSNPPPAAELGRSVAVSGDTAVVGMPLDDSGAGNDVGSAYIFIRSGTTWTLQQFLASPEGGQFGMAVALSGDTAAIRGGSKAYVYVRSGTTWALQQALSGSGGGFPNSAGASVSISGDTLVVGSPLEVFQLGAAYVFVRSGTTWTEQQRLLASDGGGADRFGASVSVAGDTAVIGANLEDTAGGPDAGAAYVFVRSGTTWTEQQKLVAPDGAAGDSFGTSVSAFSDTAVIGSPSDDNVGGLDAGSAYVYARSGALWTFQQKLLASDALATAKFGSSVSISGDTALVGAPLHDNPSLDAGAAYVFVRSGTTWTEQQRLAPADVGYQDTYGASVSVSGDSALLGAPGIFGRPGKAYVFVRSGTTWSEQQKLLGSEHSTPGDHFGSGVSISGDTVVVGAPDDVTPAGSRAGSAYVFVRVGSAWSDQQKLFASDAEAIDQFGSAVALSGDTLVVGAVGDDPAGAAYVFVRSGTVWTEQQKLVPSGGGFDESFGASVAISGDTVVVGAPTADTVGGLDTGAAYVFARSGTTWTQEQRLVAADAAAGDELGISVSASGDTVVLGAWQDSNAGGVQAGAAYVFVRSATIWNQEQKLLASDGATQDFFGASVSVFGDTAVVGSFGDDNGGGANAGAAYVFVRSGAVWTEQQKLTASDGAAGRSLGRAVSLFMEQAAVSDSAIDPAGPSVYVFARSGTTWTQQAKLQSPDPAPFDGFGGSVSISDTTVVVGARGDDTPGGLGAGSAHVYREAQADVAVTKTDGQLTAVPGDPLTYTITVSNAGPTAAPATTVTDVLPGSLLGATWNCVPSAGSTCTPAGAGNINDVVNILPGGSLTYSLTGTVDPAATGLLTNTVSAIAPAGVDPNPTNDSATDVDTLTPEADLSIAKTDSADPVLPGDPLSYTLAVANLGPSNATSLTVVDSLPPDVTFVSSVPGPPTCILAGATVTCGLGSLPAGGNATVTINTTVNTSAGATIVNTATVSAAETDPAPANNSASQPTTVIHGEAELTHGFEATYDLAAQPGPVADEDVFRIGQKPYSSYEVVVDATSGDIGVGAGPLLQRIGPDGATVLQASSPIGTGSNRSLRWRNAGSTAIDNQTIRVRSAGCTTDCGPDDVYRIRAYETTYSVPRFNNAGTQVTVLVLQNPTDYPIGGDVYFFTLSGTVAGVHGFSLNPRGTLVLNTATVPGVEGASGALTVAHDGRYGDLSGKTVALEPATGFSFDSALEPRPK
jgi:uncharacterized repeat protein (TIGR01451 family)